MVEKAVAGDVVVESEDGGWAGIGGEPEDLFLVDSVAEQVGEERVGADDSSCEQIGAEPAAVFTLDAERAELWSGEEGASIFGVDEARIELHGADGAHGEDGGFDLVEEGAEVADDAALVGIPEAVEGGEAGGGVGLVDGGVVEDVGVALRDLECEGGELFREGRVKEAGGGRAAAVMEQADDGADAEALHVGEEEVWELPGLGGFEVLPEDGCAHGLEAEIANELEVSGDALAMPGEFELIEEEVVDAVDSAFDTTPELKRWLGGRQAGSPCRSCGSIRLIGCDASSTQRNVGFFVECRRGGPQARVELPGL